MGVRALAKICRLGERTLANRLRGLPVFMHVAPTRACNLRCGYCFQCTRVSSMMTRDTFLGVLGAARRFNLGVLSFTGGEPLLWEQIDWAVSEASRAGLVVGITTNGTLLDRARVIALARSGLDQLIVSIDGVESLEQSEKTLGANPHVLESMRLARSLGVLVSANCVLGPYNSSGIGSLLRVLGSQHFALSIGFLDSGLVGQVCAAAEQAMGFRLPRDRALLDAAVGEILRLKRRGSLVVEPDRYFQGYAEHLVHQSTLSWVCAESKRHSLQVSPEGNLYLCTRRGELPGPIRLADLSLTSLREALRSVERYSMECNATCYCNCSYSNYYYRRHPAEFVSSVGVRVLASHIRGRRQFRITS